MEPRPFVALTVALIVTLASTAAFQVAPVGTVGACSCVPMNQLEWLAEAAVVVHGETVDKRREHIGGIEQIVWDFAVDERLRGDTGDVIAIAAMAEPSSCGAPPPGDLDGYLQLPAEQPGGYFPLLYGCADSIIAPEVAEAYFDAVPPITGRGPPAAVVAFDARGHNAIVLDGDGDPLRYLPGDERTVGLAVCPGGKRLVQVRGGSYRSTPAPIGLDAVVWDTSTWTRSDPIGVDLVDSLSRVTTICRTEDASEVDLRFETYPRRLVEIVDGQVVARTDVAQSDVAVYADDVVDLSLNAFSNNVQIQASAGPAVAPVELVLPGGEAVRLSDIVSVVPTDEGVSMTLNRSDQYVELTATPESWELGHGSLGHAYTVIGAGTPVGVVFPDVFPDVYVIPEAAPVPAPAPLFERSGSSLTTNVPSAASQSVTRQSVTSQPVTSQPVTSQPASASAGFDQGAAQGWRWTALASGAIVAIATAIAIIIIVIASRRRHSV